MKNFSRAYGVKQAAPNLGQLAFNRCGACWTLYLCRRGYNSRFQRVRGKSAVECCFWLGKKPSSSRASLGLNDAPAKGCSFLLSLIVSLLSCSGDVRWDFGSHWVVTSKSTAILCHLAAVFWCLSAFSLLMLLLLCVLLYLARTAKPSQIHQLHHVINLAGFSRVNS